MDIWIHGYLNTWISVFFGYMDTWILWISIFFIIHSLDILSKYPDIFGYFFKLLNVEKRQSNSSVKNYVVCLFCLLIRFVLWISKYSIFLASKDIRVINEGIIKILNRTSLLYSWVSWNGLICICCSAPKCKNRIVCLWSLEHWSSTRLGSGSSNTRPACFRGFWSLGSWISRGTFDHMRMSVLISWSCLGSKFFIWFNLYLCLV